MNVKIRVGDYKWYVPVSCDSSSSAGRAKYETQNKLLNSPTLPPKILVYCRARC